MYHLNIIGNGRVTLSLLKMIFDQKLDTHIKKITVWCREHKVIFNNKVITKADHVNEDIVRIHLMHKSIGNKLNKIEEKIEFKTFTCIDDLVDLSAGNGKNVLLLAVKYNLDELIYIDKAKKERFNPNYLSHFELLLSRMKGIIPGLSSYDVLSGYDLQKKILGDLDCILNEKHLVHTIINELSQSISAGYTRLYNLEHSAIGIRYLSQVLRNFNGIIFNMINEVDTTNCILHKFSDLKPEIIVSPCENDTIRAKYFLRKNLKLKGISVKEISLSYIGPHNHSGFIPLETVKVDGKLLTDIMNTKKALTIIEEVTKEVNSFGEDVFLKKGSSDEDTVMGICATLSSLFKNLKKPVVRVSCYDKKDHLFSGLPGFFVDGQFNPMKNIVLELSQESRERLLKAKNEQKLINQRIMSVLRQRPVT